MNTKHPFFKTEPMKHQYEVLKDTFHKRAFAVLWEMGAGKTKLAVDTAGMLRAKGWINGMLVIAPKGCYAIWIDEVEKHMSAKVGYRMALWMSGAGKKYMSVIESMVTPSEDLDILVMNIEALRSKTARGIAERFMKSHDALMIIDESTAIKNPKALQTKACVALGQHAAYKRIMTGTPITQSPLDVYSQFNFLQSGILGFTSFFSFRAEFAKMVKVQMNGKQVNLVKGFRNLGDLKKRMAPHSSRITKDECLDLPPKTFGVEYVELTKEQALAYKTMKETCLAVVDNEMITVASALTALAKLQQIVCGHLIDEEGEAHDLPNNRIDACMDVLERHGGKAIVWCNFVKDVENVRTALSSRYGEDSHVLYYGHTDTQDRRQACERLQKDDSCRWMIATSAAAKGLTLTAASLNVYYSHSFNLETYLQSQDRTHRRGQNLSVHNVSLVCKGTVDEKIVQALNAKKDIANEVIGEIRQLFR